MSRQNVHRRVVAHGLISIPSVIFGSNVLSYLDWNDLAALDISFTNKKDRPYILECFSYCLISIPVDLKTISKCKWIKKRKMSLKSISTSDQKLVTSAAFRGFLAYNNGLLDLALNTTFVSDSVAKFIGEKCKRLECLEIVPISHQHILPTVQLMCPPPSRLKCLRANVYETSNDNILSIIHQYPLLQQIHFGDIFGGFVKAAIDYSTCAVLPPGLSYLSILFLRRSNITADGLREIARQCPLLFAIKIENCFSLRSTALLPPNIFSNLMLFCMDTSIFSFGETIPDEWVLHMTNNCKRITNFYVINGRFSTLSSSYIAEGWPKLQGLAVRELQEGSIGVLGFSLFALTQLSVSEGTYQENSLDFFGYYFFPELEDLSIPLTPEVNDEGFYKLIKGRYRLKTINFFGCSGLTDMSVLLLSQVCSHLVKISLLQCQMTDLCLQHLASGCLDIQSIILDTPNLTDRGIRHLIRRSRKLINLEVPLSVNITGNSLLSLIKVNPKIHIKCHVLALTRCEISMSVIKRHFTTVSFLDFPRDSRHLHHPNLPPNDPFR